jgi:hypothetical protein
MIRYESDCVDCGKPCMHEACPHFLVPHYYCDECGEETDIYYVDDEQLCAHCTINRFEKVGE